MRKLRAVILATSFLIFTLYALFHILIALTTIDFAKKSDEENVARVLRWNLRECGEIVRVVKGYGEDNISGFGEGTITVKCSNDKAYLIASYLPCDKTCYLDVYCFHIITLNPNSSAQKQLFRSKS